MSRKFETPEKNYTLKEISNSTQKKYSELLKERIKQKALEYLLKNRGMKGNEIEYRSLDMAEYLLPFNNKLKIEEKCELFAVRNKMINIPSNFSSKCDKKCECGEKENMKHIYECKFYNNWKTTIPYEKVYNGNIRQQIEVYKRFKENLVKKEKQSESISNPCDISPLYNSKG